MIYILRHPKTNAEIKTKRKRKVKLYQLHGYKLVNQYDPTATQNCKAKGSDLNKKDRTSPGQ